MPVILLSCRPRQNLALRSSPPHCTPDRGTPPPLRCSLFPTAAFHFTVHGCLLLPTLPDLRFCQHYRLPWLQTGRCLPLLHTACYPLPLFSYTCRCYYGSAGSIPGGCLHSFVVHGRVPLALTHLLTSPRTRCRISPAVSSHPTFRIPLLRLRRTLRLWLPLPVDRWRTSFDAFYHTHPYHHVAYLLHLAVSPFLVLVVLIILTLNRYVCGYVHSVPLVPRRFRHRPAATPRLPGLRLGY